MLGRDGLSALSQYNPGKQQEFCRNVERCHTGKAPSIAIMAQAYGRDTIESWLEIQLNDLSEFAGCKDKLTKQQRIEMAAMIADAYPHYKLTEFMLFCQRFKKCEYGRFYGAVDPMVIFSALKEFDAERSEFMRQIQHKSDEARRSVEHAEANREINSLRNRYAARIPDAFTADAPITFLQYQLMGFDQATDEHLTAVIAGVKDGKIQLPTDVSAMLRSAQPNDTNVYK